MDSVFRLTLNKEERNALIRAVEAMAEEYKRVAEGAILPYLSRGFQDDAAQFNRLALLLRNLADRHDVNQIVARELAKGYKINAIKAVREATLMSLKEAKDYVDNYTDDPNYGAGII